MNAQGRRIVVLAGGVGAAKFLRGLARVFGPRRLTVIVNTADDEEFHGLYVSPDVDTIIYTLGGVVNPATGWGLSGESFITLQSLERFFGKPWFNLGDRDLATHLFRTGRLRLGATLSQVAAEIARAFAVKARILPMSDDRVRTFVKVAGRAPMPFQEYFVKGRARGRIERIELRGIKRARPTDAVIDALHNSAAVILAPSNPFVSLGPILSLRGVRAQLARRRASVAAISPIVGGKTIKGPADRMLRGLGYEVSALGVARLYRDIAGIFLIDNVDRKHAAAIGRLGMRTVATPTVMSTPARAAHLAEVVLRTLEV